MDTIFALSSGRPPAAIAVMRISGPEAMRAGRDLTGRLPPPRQAALRTVRDIDGVVLDRALVIAFPGPATATGEDLVELHLHGGRAVVRAVEHALGGLPGVRRAIPGEFTRRSLEHARIDLAQAQGLADLLEAETEAQRRAAMAAAEGAVGRLVDGWMQQLTIASARIEAELDFADEDDVGAAAAFDVAAALTPLIAEIDHTLSQPSVERLGDGVRVVLAGPPNAGKSSLFNALLDRDAAIVTEIAGTTRDLLDASVMRGGISYRLTDTAGLSNDTNDPVEQIGITKAQATMAVADVILWLGPAPDAPAGAIKVAAKSDIVPSQPDSDVSVSVYRPDTIADIWNMLHRYAAPLLAVDDRTIGLHEAQRLAAWHARDEAAAASATSDPLIAAEHVRVATRHLGKIVGRDATEAMLNTLFSRFCLGK